MLEQLEKCKPSRIDVQDCALISNKLVKAPVSFFKQAYGFVKQTAFVVDAKTLQKLRLHDSGEAFLQV